MIPGHSLGDISRVDMTGLRDCLHARGWKSQGCTEGFNRWVHVSHTEDGETWK